MSIMQRAALLLSLVVVNSSLCMFAGQTTRAKSSNEHAQKSLVLSHADYLDRVQAIWTAQMIGQITGVRFEHQPASVLKETPPSQVHGHAPVDDDYYYEMVAIRAFEKYGIGLTVEQLGQQWVENNAGSWGSSEQALLLLKRGIKPPATGHPRYNKLWWTIGPQFSSDVYGALAPGLPNVGAALARNLGHINGYAEGTDGAVFVAGMISIAFAETDTHAIVRKAAALIHPDSPYRKCLDMVISMADAGRNPQEIFRAVDERWGIEYPATNNAVVNGGIVATSVWFGGGDYQTTLQLAVHAADFADTDCNAANSASVVAAMHGMKALPAAQVAELHDRIVGAEMGPLKLTPPVDESIEELAKRTARIGMAILSAHGASDDGGHLAIPEQEPVTQPAEIFRLADLMLYWNKDWTLDRAGFGGAGGGMRGIRGITYLDGEVLATYPRDEVRGVVLRRSLMLGNAPILRFKAGVDVGRAWQLQVYVNDSKVIDKIIDGLYESRSSDGRQWEEITIDLADYRAQDVVLRLYQRVLIPHHEAGNAYWRDLEVW
ncbi:MAG TPA: ADP-ribosylglycohydrolase family protein [Terriglobales bacterium]|nr:ADP-ribosylglycohydrolase family protein [Terriglobales bacterium]